MPNRFRVVPTQPAEGYRTAFLDWLACAFAGRDERATRAIAASGPADVVDAVAIAATAGHILDFDDTFPDGIAHVSAATAPAALVVAAHLDRSLEEALRAYADGFEAMAALAAASHPTLYDRGWHPTAVCGPLGAATAAATLLELSDAERESAAAVAMLRAGGSRAAFGSDGKAIQVALAAAAGVQAALLARGGAAVGRESIVGQFGFEAVYGATWPVDLWEPAAQAAIERNWLKLHPSCLGTHAPIEAASAIRARGEAEEALARGVEVVVNPVGRQAAHLGAVNGGLAAKFSIPYCVAHTLIRGAPSRADFEKFADDVATAAESVTVSLDDSLPDFGAALKSAGTELALVQGPRGTPDSPATTGDLTAKIAELAGNRLDGVMNDRDAKARDVLDAIGVALNE
jgi:2-methylcitrate dehydratase PrpD